MKIDTNDYFQKINCIPCLTQIMELQFIYPGLWLVNANLNIGISTQISLILRIKTQITELRFKYPVTEWNGVEHVVMNIDESVFRMPIYSVQANYIVMSIDESMFCMPIYSVQGRYNPDRGLDKANLNNGITTQISRNYNSNNYLYSRLGVNQLCCFRGIYTRSILFRIRKYQLRMRLLHNTELYRVNITNSDYPSAQTHRGAFASYQTANSSPII